MDSRAMWMRLKTRRWVYSFSIVSTLALGILIGTVVSFGVKGKEGQKSSDATPLVIPSPKQLSNEFSQIAKQLGPSVVNINTESTIKITAAAVAWMTFSIASLAGRADKVAPAATTRFVSVHSVPA